MKCPCNVIVTRSFNELMQPAVQSQCDQASSLVERLNAARSVYAAAVRELEQTGQDFPELVLRTDNARLAYENARLCS